MSTNEELPSLNEVFELHAQMSLQIDLLQAQLDLAQTTLQRLVDPRAELKPAGADAVYEFIIDRCDEGCPHNDGDGTKALHADYLRYSRFSGVPSAYWLGEREFRERLIELGFEQAKSNGRRFWRELKLLSSNERVVPSSTKSEEN